MTEHPANAPAPRLSFEFFPPRTEGGQASLGRVAEKLNQLHPAFFSCTYGAGGSTREGTCETVKQLLEMGIDAAPHLSIGADSEEETSALLDLYRDMGVKRIVALRGDLPSGMGRTPIVNNAESLVKRIRAHSGNHFQLEVAAYPETHPDARSPQEDLRFFSEKVNAGANGAITQYFFNPYAYFDFMDRSIRAGVDVPIVPGILPITNYEGLIRISEKCGADVPRWLRKRLEELQDDEPGLKSFGVDVITRLCEDLLAAGAPGLHFYTLNRWGASLAVCNNLGHWA